MALVAPGGTIVIDGTYTLSSTERLGRAGSNKAVTLTGDTLDLSNVSTVQVVSDVTISTANLIYKDAGTLYANGNAFTVSKGVEVTNALKALYGGSSGKAVESTNVTLFAGSYATIYGGCNGADVTGTAKLHIGGDVNTVYRTVADAEEVVSNHSVSIYGGGYGSGTTNATQIVFGDNADDTVYSYMIYGGGLNGATAVSTSITMNGGKVAQIFGGNNGAAMTGSTDVKVLGGEVTRRIYGGCYNEVDAGLFSGDWKSDHYVTGNTSVTIGSGLNFSRTSKVSTSLGTQAAYEGIRAGSRTDEEHDAEKAALYFDSEATQSKFSGVLGTAGDATAVKVFYIYNPSYTPAIITR